MDASTFWKNVEARNRYMRDLDIAELLSVPKSRVSRWKRNGTFPRGDHAVTLARELGTTVEFLLWRDASASDCHEGR
jgi:transcriptional regulator with XRE-family HTH domain